MLDNVHVLVWFEVLLFVVGFRFWAFLLVVVLLAFFLSLFFFPFGGF